MMMVVIFKRKYILDIWLVLCAKLEQIYSFDDDFYLEDVDLQGGHKLGDPRGTARGRGNLFLQR